MLITPQLKADIVEALLSDMNARGYTSQNKYAQYVRSVLDIPFDKAAFSQIKKEDGRNALKDASWLILAKHFNLMGDQSWQIAETHTFRTMQTYLESSKKHGLFRVLCDHASYGKTFATRYFVENNKGSVFYVDCSEYPTKNQFIEDLASQLGLSKTGTYDKLWREITDKLLLMEKPLLILDEFGDVQDSVITLLKSLYNKADRGNYIGIGVFHIGADNLRKKLYQSRRKHKPSYAEYWSRFGEDILTLNFENPQNLKQAQQILESDANKILDANLPPELGEYRAAIFNKAVSLHDLRIIREQINVKLDLIK